MSIESTNASAGLRLKSPSTFNTFIDFEEGSDQRFIMGVLSTDDSFYISTGSALVSGSMLKANRATGDIEIIHNISASAVSASTYYGDGSNLTGISSTPFPFVGDAVITGSLTISGSQVFTMDNNNVILGANAGGGGINPPTDTANVIIGPSAAGEGSMNNGSRNIIIGSGSAHGMRTGDDCVAIGS